MLDALFHIRRFVFRASPEQWTEDDQRNLDTFVTSQFAKSVAKAIRNRIAERTGDAVTFAGEAKAKEAQAKIWELADILLEWKNLREDLLKKHA